MDRLIPEQRHKNMQRIRAKDTDIEVILRKALWLRGIRYRKNYRALPGTPDIAITKYRIAVFCDSEFFHGADWEKQQERISKGKNAGFWLDKISHNMDHDREVNAELNGLGWKVIRFWGQDIKKDLSGCVRTIEEAIFDYKLEDKKRCHF
ncbi:MAG: very short patch repair endonuclease [Lachnospiraceae bacterium]|nr:very short patch repair endonuclease [Lachnospiraceae bacterium]